jgi:DNA-binding NarL/FixJ family response regulator
MSVRVFVADPQPFFCEALSVALEEDERVQVLGWSRDPVEAARLIGSLLPDVLVCDLELAFEAPSDVLRSFVNDARMIVLTRGHVGDALLAAAEAGASGCVGHDIGSRVLSSLIVEAMEDGRFVVDPDGLGAALRRAGAARREPKPPGLSRLTSREREILDLLAEGLDNPAIAKQLHVSTHTVRTHVGRVLRKLGVSSRSEAVRIALSSGTSDATVSVLRIEGPTLEAQ